MGWFWAQSQPISSGTSIPHPLSRDGTPPPPGCPMHDVSSDSPPFPPRAVSSQPTESSCPVRSPNQPPNYPPSSSASTSSQSTLSKLNPLNYMPTLSNTRPDDSPQSHDLPLEREMSTIPRGDSTANWEYPSPQQMYNAMLRKGYTDTDTSAVESMVAVHNFLNEGAWAEIRDWESIFASGLGKAWERCREGEGGIAMYKAKREYEQYRRKALGVNTSDGDDDPKLLRFQGRPGQPTPKSRILTALAWAFPQSFNQEPPFDRHDWYVARRRPDGSTKEVRYVIDYYGGGLQATGEPVFYLDIRPALDTPTAAAERLMRWGGDVWWRASGGSARREAALAGDP